ncbi:MAG: magnesium chelatase, partial [Candidatus Limnocylindrales bacterium]
RIITPLKDRLGSQIRTHYPRTLDDEIAIVRQEKIAFPAEEGVPSVHVPRFIEEIVAELTHLARRSGEISQRSGVSVRVSIANLEVLEAAALKRAVRLGEAAAAPRISDLGAVVASTAGKIELETAGDESPEDRIVERLITKAVYATFNRLVGIDELEPLVEAFENGLTLDTGDQVRSNEYVRWVGEVPGLADAVQRTGVLATTSDAGRPTRTSLGPQAEAALVASAVEFLLEGLHLARRLNKDRIGGSVTYRR